MSAPAHPRRRLARAAPSSEIIILSVSLSLSLSLPPFPLSPISLSLCLSLSLSSPLPLSLSPPTVPTLFPLSATMMLRGVAVSRNRCAADSRGWVCWGSACSACGGRGDAAAAGRGCTGRHSTLPPPPPFCPAPDGVGVPVLVVQARSFRASAWPARRIVFPPRRPPSCRTDVRRRDVLALTRYGHPFPRLSLGVPQGRYTRGERLANLR